jgi:protein-arginine kinase activator protein McsA
MRCEICDKKSSPGNLVVDYCHRTKKIRGHLCRSCDYNLEHYENGPPDVKSASFDENAGLQQRALRYLGKYR